MDEDVLMKELVNRLTFEVGPLGKEDVIISPNRNGTPLNVKVRVRNKDEPKLIQRGIVPLPRGKQVTIPERIQLIGSDHTTISFNVFMEATSSKESSPESRKRGFHFFKIGGCLGTSYDQDEGPYLPSSSNKDALRTNRSSKSASLIMDEAEDLSDRHKFNSVPRNQKGLFGKCKPGGCLDPPFGEDKYPYSLPKVQPETNVQQPLKKIEHQTEKISVKTPKNIISNSSKISTKSEDESKPVLNLYPRKDESYSITSKYSNSIITYPPVLTPSQTQNNANNSTEKKSRNRSFDSSSPRLSYEYPETYFIPPKDVLRPKEEERRYSKELSNDKMKFDDDDRNEDKMGFGQFRTSLDKNPKGIDRFQGKEKIKQELFKQIGRKSPEWTDNSFKSYKESNRRIEIHDTYPEKSGSQFGGNEDDIDNLEPHETDTIKGTRRFGENEDDIGNLETMPHDTDKMKDSRRLGGNEDDLDKLGIMPHDTDTLKDTRRFGGIEDDIDKLESMSHDTDTVKGTQRFGENQHDIDNLETMRHDTDTMKDTKLYGGNEVDIDKLEPLPHGPGTIKGTRRCSENEDDICNLEMPHDTDTDTMKDNRRFGGNEDNIDKLESMPHDTDTIKGTRNFGENEDYIDYLRTVPHNTDTMKDTRRFEGNENDIDKLESTPHETGRIKDSRRYGENENGIDNLETEPHYTDTMEYTGKSGENKEDRTSESAEVESTPNPEQNPKIDGDFKEEQKKAFYKDAIANDDRSLLTNIDKLDTTRATRDSLSSDSILSENKEFATSSIESIGSGEHLTNVKLKVDIIDSQTKDLNSEKVVPPWNIENIQNEILQKRRSSIIFQKTPFVEITHDEISKSNPLKRNTFAIIDSRTSLQKQIEEISTRRIVIENSQVNNGNESVIIDSKTTFKPGFQIMISDADVNLPQKTERSNSLSHIQQNSSHDNPNTEKTELIEDTNIFDSPNTTKPIIDTNLFDNSTKKTNEIISDGQFNEIVSTEKDHFEYGFLTSADKDRPGCTLKDELINRTNKEKTNKVDASKTGSSNQDARVNQNIESNNLSPDTTILGPKVLSESKTILVNLSFQSYVDANEKRIIQTLNPLIKPHPRYKDDTITVFQSYIKYGNEIRIPVGPQHDLVLNLFEKSQKPEEINIDHAEENKPCKINAEDILKKNLTAIYETGLIPLHSVIKDLIEEINTLSAQQELLKVKVGRAERSKSLRLIPVNNRCACRRS